MSRPDCTRGRRPARWGSNTAWLPSQQLAAAWCKGRDTARSLGGSAAGAQRKAFGNVIPSGQLLSVVTHSHHSRTNRGGLIKTGGQEGLAAGGQLRSVEAGARPGALLGSTAGARPPPACASGSPPPRHTNSRRVMLVHAQLPCCVLCCCQHTHSGASCPARTQQGRPRGCCRCAFHAAPTHAHNPPCTCQCHGCTRNAVSVCMHVRMT